MTRRHRITPAVALVALVLTGCGSAPAARDGHATASPTATGPLRVAVTDGRVGDATLADGAGSVQLRVPARVVDPSALHLRRPPREGVGAGASCADGDLMPDAGNLDAVIASTLCLLNGERADAGLAPLTQSDRLAGAAIEHSEDMVRNQYFEHEALDGRDVVDRVRATGYIPSDRAWTVGENLAWGTGTLATPRNIVAAWMNSQGHRENILRAAFREIGFGVVLGNPRSTDGQGATYTTNFGAVSGGRAPDEPVEPAAAEVATRTTTPRARSASLRARRARARATRRHKQRVVKARRSARP